MTAKTNLEINQINSSPLAPRQSSSDLLLSAAAELFTSKGYDGVSTREIADLAGVNLALIQYHFGSKAKLFLATVDHLTHEKSELDDSLRPVPSDATPGQGAKELVYFIHSFLSFLLQSAQAQASCRLIYRELFSGKSNDSELFQSVVGFIAERHAQPTERRVCSILKFILPESDEEKLKAIARSVLGQCSFYVTHGPLISKMDCCCLEECSASEKLSRHIADFTLRGIGCSEEIISEAIGEVYS